MPVTFYEEEEVRRIEQNYEALAKAFGLLAVNMFRVYAIRGEPTSAQKEFAEDYLRRYGTAFKNVSPRTRHELLSHKLKVGKMEMSLQGALTIAGNIVGRAKSRRKA